MCNGQCRHSDASADSVRITDEDIERRFGHHPASGQQPQLYGDVRASYIASAKWARDLIPAGADQQYAVTKIMEAMRAVIGGIACNGVGAEGPVYGGILDGDALRMIGEGNGIVVNGAGENSGPCGTVAAE